MARVSRIGIWPLTAESHAKLLLVVREKYAISVSIEQGASSVRPTFDERRVQSVAN
jgi:uncharacterized protein YabN with tetrapyrrole methylase and pyrophosphatase domain